MTIRTPGMEKQHAALAALSSRYIDVEALPWKPTPYKGVDIKILMEDPETGITTSLTRFAPGAELPMHEHVELEQSWVLEGRRAPMARMKIEGSFVALITPFNKDGAVDFGAFRTLLEFQERNGTRAVLIMGSTGETSLLSPDEKKQVVVETAKMKSGRMLFFYGCTGNNTDATIANVKFAKANGADGAILAAPAYICASEADGEQFFLDVADATDLPLGIYNNPPRVKTDLHWDHLLRIFKHPNYVVHKESTTRVGQVAQVLAAKPDVSVMCCDSPNLGLVVPTMSLGGHGTANMTGNIAPAELATISTPWASYKEAEAFKATYLRCLPLLHYTYSAINPVAVKSLMKALGLPAGDLRRPLRGLEGEALEKGVRIVRDLGLDQKYGFKLAPTLKVA
jgi:4-hydroxy-tetrahydrodipicolinate synthase